MLRAAEEEEGVSERDLGSHREDVSSNSGDPTSTSLLQRPSEVEERNFCQQSVVRDDSECLDERAVEELIWWTQQVQHWNGRPILTSTPDITVETDASLLGWGVVSGETRTGGLWSEEERAQHINMLELMGGDFAAKIFARDKQDIHIHLRMNNTTAIAYINHMGGTKSHNLAVTSSLQFVAVVPPEGDHLIGRAPTRDVQHSGRCGISYDPHNRVDAGQISVQQCVTTMGLMFDRTVRFLIEQPVAEIRELAPRSLCSSNRCFSDILAGRTRICLSPFLFGRQMFTKVRREGCTIVLIAPTWSTQQWYPVLLELLIDYPLLLPSHKMLLQDPFNRLHPMMLKNQNQLAAWKLSGQVTQQEALQYGLQHSSRLDGARELTPHINLDGTGGIAGVTRGRSISFL